MEQSTAMPTPISISHSVCTGPSTPVSGMATARLPLDTPSPLSMLTGITRTRQCEAPCCESTVKGCGPWDWAWA
jgi:hypothetical protein